MIPTKTGMVREDKQEKLNHLSYWTPQTLKRYAMHMKRGELKHGRANWQRAGYPQIEYLESMMRHLIAAWEHLDTNSIEITDEGIDDHIAAIIFNAQALMNEQHLDVQ